MRAVLVCLSFSIIIFFTSCAYKSTSNELATFESQLLKNGCDFSLVDKKIKDGDDVILWGIQGGSLARNCQDFTRSTEFFDKAELHYKFDVDLKNHLYQTWDKTKSVIINNNINSYEGNMYEKTLVNTYKALNFLALNDKNNARVEFNRALERQRIASEYFAKDIASLNEKNAKNLQELKNAQISYNNGANLRASQQSKKSRTQVASQPIFFNESSISQITNNPQNVQGSLYPDFINPFTTYISALFFLNDKSFQKAADLFKECLRMSPNSPQIIKDFNLADKMASEFNANFQERFVWLIYENGFGAIKRELRIDLPLFLVSNSLLYASVALPKLEFRAESYPYLTIKNDFGDSFNTALIADMDSIEAAEFDKRYFGIAMEAIISSAVKIIAQKQMYDADPLLGLFSAFYQIATTKTDVRHWSALPKRFMSASIPIKDGNIAILDEKGTILLREYLRNDKNAIIYLKSSQRGELIAHKIYF